LSFLKYLHAKGRYSNFYLQKLKARADEGITPCRIFDYMNFESDIIPFSILALTLHGKVKQNGK